MAGGESQRGFVLGLPLASTAALLTAGQERRGQRSKPEGTRTAGCKPAPLMKVHKRNLPAVLE